MLRSFSSLFPGCLIWTLLQWVTNPYFPSFLNKDLFIPFLFTVATFVSRKITRSQHIRFETGVKTFQRLCSLKGQENLYRDILLFAKQCCRGWFCFFEGCMFAEKTSCIESIGRYFVHAGYKVFAIKYSKDNRGSSASELCTHNHVTFPAMTATYFREVDEAIQTQNPDLILFDEGQFFPDSPYWVQKWIQEGRLIAGAGLNETKDRQEWPTIVALSKLANHTIPLLSVCYKCHLPASHTAFIRDLSTSSLASSANTTTSSSSSSSSTSSSSSSASFSSSASTSRPFVCVGGDESFVPCCSQCHPIQPDLELFKNQI